MSDNTRLGEAIRELAASQAPTPKLKDEVHGKDPADKMRVWAIVARMKFAGYPHPAIAETLGKSTKTVQRITKEDGFLEYFEGYIEMQTKQVDKVLRAKLVEQIPRAIDRLVDLSKQDETRHVAFLATRELLDLHVKLSPTGTIKGGAMSLPPQVQELMRIAGEKAKQIPQVIDAEKVSVETGSDEIPERSSEDNGTEQGGGSEDREEGTGETAEGSGG